MCGIIGRYDLRAGRPDATPLRNAMSLLVHRGPDGSGFWMEPPFCFGHCRLAVIDLENGVQPMASDDSRHVVVFNGEIYNFIELRADLIAKGHGFRTGSDTEVLLNGYREWGTALPERLEGMFAIAIADRRERSLFLARDRFGEKPLFVHEHRDHVTFASTIGALAALPDIDLPIDAEALSDYLCLNYVPGTRTMIGGIRRLAPASWCLFTPTQTRAQTYWTPTPALQRAFRDIDEAATEASVLIDRSVSHATRSDVPVTVFLSGGIDSSLIAESARRQGAIERAYCLDFGEASYSEYPNARAVADRLGLKLERVEMAHDALEGFCEMVGHADDPLADSSALAVGTLARAAATSYKVALSGDGGDELFGGYLTYAASRLHRRYVAVLPRAARSILAKASTLIPVSPTKVSIGYKAWRFLRAAALPTAQAHFTWNGVWLPQDAMQLLADPDARVLAADSLQRIAYRHGLDRGVSLDDLQRADIGDYLPNDILVKVDRMTMAHGLESRAPFLTSDLSAFGLGLPERFKRARGLGSKAVLRALAARRFGQEIARAPKQGFGIPLHGWLRTAARPLMEDLIGPDSLRAFPMLDSAAVARAKQRHLAGKAQLGYELWGLMVLMAWHRTRIARRPAGRAVENMAELSLARPA